MNTDRLLRANSNLLEAGSPFVTLANAKACMEIFMVTVGQLELIGSGSPFSTLANAKAWM
jgi:hypothetical protein